MRMRPLRDKVSRFAIRIIPFVVEQTSQTPKLEQRRWDLPKRLADSSINSVAVQMQSAISSLREGLTWCECWSPTRTTKYSVAALNAGAHVICEKSLAHTLQSGKRMVAAASGAKGKTMVAYNYRGFKRVQRFKELVDQGRIYNLDTKSYHAIVRFLQDWGFADRNNWRCNVLKLVDTNY